jgi:hypothetical protein
MSYFVSTIGSVTPGPALLAAVETNLLSVTGWSKIENLITPAGNPLFPTQPGVLTWNVYKSAAASNSQGADWYLALGYHAINNVNLYVTVFEEWDATNKLCRNFVPGYPYATVGAGYVSNMPWSPLPNGEVPSGFVGNTSASIANGGSYTVIPTTFTLTAGGGCTPRYGINTVTVSAGGTGYPASSTLSCTVTGGGSPTTTAVVTATTNGSGVVTGYTIVDRGEGYTTLPTITVDTSGGGSGATNAVTLRVVKILVTSQASGGPTSGGTFSVSGGTGSGFSATPNWNTNPIFLSIGTGATSSNIFYSITPDRVIFSGRVNGNGDSGAFYAGLYDSFQSATYDPFPLCMINLYSGTNTTAYVWTGYGGYTREPRVTNQSNTYFGGWLWNTGQNNCFTNPSGWQNPDIYSNLYPVSRVVAWSTRAAGSYTAPRGLLKDVFNCNASGLTTPGDTLTFNINGTNYTATLVGNGLKNFMLQV